MQQTFINESQPVKKTYPNQYGFNAPSKYLFSWNRLFQAVVSQAGTFLLTGKFHDRDYAIYKSEGGCRIVGVDDLVLGRSGAYFDYEYQLTQGPDIQKIVKLIDKIVLEWNPEDPIESMLQSAGEYISVDKEVIRSKINLDDNPFGGNDLSSFFHWDHPFSKPPVDRPYERFCLIKFKKWTDEQVDQYWADQDLGEELLKLINDKLSRLAGGGYFNNVMCCQPSRRGNDLRFWVNTWRNTQIQGWQTEEKLREFINNNEPLKTIPRN